MTERQKVIYENYKRVTSNIEEARIRRGTGEPVTLLAATKTVPIEDILFAETLGLKVAGENKQQEFTQKYDAVSGVLDYHFIGHLQRNKAKYIVGRASLIHSVDSERLAEEINRLAEREGIKQDVLLEINIGREESKSGFSPDKIETIYDNISHLFSLNVRGIMAMAPICEKKEDYRKYFKETYSIFIDFFSKKSHNIRESVLSMGMSDSYIEAVEEGATMVRVGSAIFGERIYP